MRGMKKKLVFASLAVAGLAAAYVLMSANKELQKIIDDAFDDDWLKDLWN